MCFPQQQCPAGYMNPLHDGLYVSSGKYECSHKCPGKIIDTECKCACVPAQSCQAHRDHKRPANKIAADQAAAYKIAADKAFANNIGTNWTRVRHVPAGNSWHPARDLLNGTEEYGDPSDDTKPWSVKWNKS